MKRIWGYYAAIFLSAFLLFQVQPMTSKALLPAFGGSYMVWGACMVFYQGMLLLGYIYAHAMQRWLGVFGYARFHWLLLLIPAAMFPFKFEEFVASVQTVPLVVAVFMNLLVTVSLPLLALSTTSVILQRWLSISYLDERTNPYVLYSASNLGSILGLLTYPAIVEPIVGLHVQGYLWWGGYGLLVAAHVFCFPRGAAKDRDCEAAMSDDSTMSDGRTRIAWFCLSAAACGLLLSVTNVLTFDVASVPFLWVLPLSVYLLAFVVTFKRKPWCPAYLRQGAYLAALVGVLLYLMTQLRLAVPVWVSILLHLCVLFVLCTNCCGRLVQTRPASVRDLTTFYLVLAFGGLVGSMLVSWVAPLITTSLVEYPICLALVFAALVGSERLKGRCSMLRDGRAVLDLGLCLLVAALSLTLLPWLVGRFLQNEQMRTHVAVIIVAVPMALALLKSKDRPWQFAVVLLCVAVAFAWTEQLYVGAAGVKRMRNFYGVYKVYDKNGMRYLEHGVTLHGREYLAGPKRGVPIGYYHATTPVASILTSTCFSFERIGMVGLGTGALVAYAEAGQSFIVYELDPDSLSIAKENFSFIGDAESKGVDVSFVCGDGRISLRKEPAGSLDLIIIDAFNSDSIPVHLLTIEAFEEYFKTLTQGGLLLLHISNQILDLAPVVYSNARASGLVACEQTNIGNRHPDADDTVWMAVSRDPAVVQMMTTRLGWRNESKQLDLPRPWTDHYSNILGAMFRW